MGIFSQKQFVLQDAAGQCEAWQRTSEREAGLVATFSNRGDAEAWLFGHVNAKCVEARADCGGPLEVCTDGETRSDAHADAYEYTAGDSSLAGARR